MRNVLIMFLGACVCFNAHAEEVRSSLRSGVEVKPGEPVVITIQAQGPMEIGWSVDPSAPCGAPCIEAVDTSSRNKDVLFSDTGASKIYRPKDGKITVEYHNTIDRPVTIDIAMIERICDSGAEACEFLKFNDLGDWLVFKVEKFTSIQTSADGSYSTIDGSTTRGRPFTIKAVWWVDDPDENSDECQEDIARYVTEGTPISEYSPYIISGRSAAKNKSVLVDIDACMPLGSDFTVPDKNVY